MSRINLDPPCTRMFAFMSEICAITFDGETIEIDYEHARLINDLARAGCHRDLLVRVLAQINQDGASRTILYKAVDYISEHFTPLT